MPNSDLKAFWDEKYAGSPLRPAAPDPWLSRYETALRAAKKIIDLGCGVGPDTEYLAKMGLRCLSCDISDVALGVLRRRVPDAETMQLDISQPLPFGSGYADVIIADLSLHYFTREKTAEIFRELKRVLSPGGLLLCRLNSTGEYEYREGDAVIEENYYLTGGCPKRFFTREYIEELLADWRTEYLAPCSTWKYANEKFVWEAAART